MLFCLRGCSRFDYNYISVVWIKSDGNPIISLYKYLNNQKINYGGNRIRPISKLLMDKINVKNAQN